MKQALLRLIPRQAKNIAKLAIARQALRSSFRYDSSRFMDHSGISIYNDKQSLWASLMMDCHRIEKGLALSEPRPGFGGDVLKRLAIGIQVFTKKYRYDPVFEAVRGAALEYKRYHQTRGFDLEDLLPIVENIIDLTDTNLVSTMSGGTLEIQRHTYTRDIPGNAIDLLHSRRSIRSFTDRPVTKQEVEIAVRAAQMSPSVCNRQSGRVRSYLEKRQIDEILAFQNGNRGFRKEINCVLLITADIRNMVSGGERNQPWIDGGMFCMSLALAFHAQRMGACCLNWSVLKNVDLAMRRYADIPDYEYVIMMMAVGHLPDKFRVAKSDRTSVSDILRFL